MKPGDLVIYTVRSGSWTTVEHWARVTAVTAKGTVTAEDLNRPDHVKTFRPIKGRSEGAYHGMRLATPYEVAMRAWWGRAPHGKLTYAGHNGWGRSRNAEASVSCDIADKALPKDTTILARVELAITELQAARNWLLERPLDPRAHAEPESEENDDADE